MSTNDRLKFGPVDVDKEVNILSQRLSQVKAVLKAVLDKEDFFESGIEDGRQEIFDLIDLAHDTITKAAGTHEIFSTLIWPELGAKFLSNSKSGS
jgi:hypothetical protein